MARKTSKNKKRNTIKKNEVSRSNKGLKKFFKDMAKKIKNRPRVPYSHRSFKRSYREDYKHEIKIPGTMHHAASTFKIVFKNWKLFLPLITIAVVAAIVFVGLMSESTYQQFQEVLDQTTEQVEAGDIGVVAKSGLLLISTITTGGLSGEASESGTVFAILIFLILWLTTIFILRHRLAGHKIKLRDALYNAMTPLISSFVIFMVTVIQCIPILLLIIVYSAAYKTDFLATPLYALAFFIFAVLMILLSGYMLSSSLMALIAVSVPGLYPMRALRTASELMMGRRIKFVLRVVSLVLILAVTWVAIMLPLIMFDLFMKQFEWTKEIPFVPVCLLIMTCFTGVYITAYLYLYYRWTLGYDAKEEENDKK